MMANILLKQLRLLLGKKPTHTLNKNLEAKSKDHVILSDQKYKIGDSVRFNAGEVDKDSGTDISGWQGRINDIDEDSKMLGVALDSLTLKQLPEEYVEVSEEEGLDWSEYYIEWDCVQKVEPRDAKVGVKTAKAEIGSRYAWSDLGQQGKEINSILQGAKCEMDQYQAWEAHILETVKFPLEAEVSEHQGWGRALKIGNRVKILEIDFIDDLYGLIVLLKGGQAFPLADLKVVPEINSPYAHTIQLYAIWFANK